MRKEGLFFCYHKIDSQNWHSRIVVRHVRHHRTQVGFDYLLSFTMTDGLKRIKKIPGRIFHYKKGIIFLTVPLARQQSIINTSYFHFLQSSSSSQGCFKDAYNVIKTEISKKLRVFRRFFLFLGAIFFVVLERFILVPLVTSFVNTTSSAIRPSDSRNILRPPAEKRPAKLFLERSVNNSQEIVFVQSLKLWGLQEYMGTLNNFCHRAYSEGIYIYYN